MGESAQFIQYVLTGITVGAIYALVGLGYNIIYNVTEVINFAQGEFVILGGLTMVFAVNTLHLSLTTGFFLTVIIVTILGALMERFTIQPLENASILTLIISTIAVSIIFRGLAMLVWGRDPYALPAFSKTPPFTLFNAIIQPQALWVLGITTVVVILLSVFFKYPMIGKAMRACADSPEASLLMGIPVKKMVLVSFALSAAIGAIAGIVITPISLMEYDRGALLGLKGFGASVLGGLGSFSGAVIAGLILGLIEALCAGYVSSGYKDAVALIVLLLVLFVKPSGFFAGKRGSLKKF